MKWLTLQRPNLIALADAWLITRFIDQGAQILFAPEADLDRLFTETSAIPFEVPGAEFSTGQTQTSFSILLTSYRFTNQALKGLNKLISQTDQKPLQEAFLQAGLQDQWTALTADHDTDEAAFARGRDAFDALYRSLMPPIQPADDEGSPG